MEGLKPKSKLSSERGSRKSADLCRRAKRRLWRILISSWKSSSRNSAYGSRLASASCSRTSRLLSSPERRNFLRCCLRVLVIVLGLIVILVNEVGVGFQIADQRMALRKAEGGLFGLLADEPANIFKPVSTALNGFGAGRIQSHCGVFLDQFTETHNGAQRLWATRIEGGSRPVTAGLAQHRSTIDPI